MTDPRTALVAAGYDAIGGTFAAWRERIVGDPRREWEDELASRLPAGARVLEPGCGPGSPDTRRLAARCRLPCVDLTTPSLPAGSLDAVAAFYVLNHVPRDLLPQVLERARRWLAPGGRLLSAFGCSDLDGWTGDWLGAPTYFSSYPAEVNSRL